MSTIVPASDRFQLTDLTGLGYEVGLVFPNSLLMYAILYYNQVYQYFILATVYMHIYLLRMA